MNYNEMQDFYKRVGDRVRGLRTERSLSREKFAEMIDITSKHEYEIEQGATNFSIGILFRICDALNISASFLIDKDQDAEQLTDPK